MNKKLVYIFAVLVVGLFVISACEQAVGRKISKAEDDNVKIQRMADVEVQQAVVNIGDIDSLSDESLDANFQIPNNVKEGIYEIKFTVLDENSDVFENEEKHYLLVLWPHPRRPPFWCWRGVRPGHLSSRSRDFDVPPT